MGELAASTVILAVSTQHLSQRFQFVRASCQTPLVLRPAVVHVIIINVFFLIV